jgi:hypothetical protein
MILERRHERLLPFGPFVRRLALYALVSAGILSGSLAVGMVGYHGLEGMSWLDAFLNAAMIMGGMGPVNELHTDAAKIFAGVYALYCGIILLISAGVLLAPVIHRFLHRFHLEIEKGEK